MSRYGPVPPFTWPVPGVRTWVAPERVFFGKCTGQQDCDEDRSCPVGVPAVSGRGGDCDCPCHNERRARLRACEA